MLQFTEYWVKELMTVESELEEDTSWKYPYLIP